MSLVPSLVLLTACDSVRPGTVGLRVWVSAASEEERYEVIRGGRYWAHPNADVYVLPTTEQRAVWTRSQHEGNPVDESITFAGMDGQAVNVDIGIGFQLVPDDQAVIAMAKRYGTDLDDVIDGRVRDSTRNSLNVCAADLTVEDIYGRGKGDLLGCVQERLNAEYEPNGLGIVRVTLNSEVRLPQRVTDALEDSIAASQEAERTRRQLEQTRAEGEKTIAKATADAEATRLRAEADAVAHRALSSSLTPELLEFRRLEVARLQAEQWDGHLPETLLGEGIPVLFAPAGR